MRRIILVLLLALGLTGCTFEINSSLEDSSGVSSSSPETEQFQVKGYGITFNYPAELELNRNVEFDKSVGGASGNAVALAIDENDTVTVQRYNLGRAVTRSNLKKVKPELDNVISRLDPEAGPGKRVVIGGFPGFEYELSLDRPKTGKSRYTAFFDGQTEYVISCQSTEQNREQIARACRSILQSVKGQ